MKTLEQTYAWQAEERAALRMQRVVHACGLGLFLSLFAAVYLGYAAYTAPVEPQASVQAPAVVNHVL